MGVLSSCFRWCHPCFCNTVSPTYSEKLLFISVVPISKEQSWLYCKLGRSCVFLFFFFFQPQSHFERFFFSGWVQSKDSLVKAQFDHQGAVADRLECMLSCKHWVEMREPAVHVCSWWWRSCPLHWLCSVNTKNFWICKSMPHFKCSMVSPFTSPMGRLILDVWESSVSYRLNCT